MLMRGRHKKPLCENATKPQNILIISSDGTSVKRTTLEKLCEKKIQGLILLGSRFVTTDNFTFLEPRLKNKVAMTYQITRGRHEE